VVVKDKSLPIPKYNILSNDFDYRVRKDNIIMRFTKKMKLATKIAYTVTALLIVIFVILIGFAVISSQNVIEDTISAEFNALSKSNGLQVQQILDTAENATNDMRSYLLKAYKQEEQELGKQANEGETPSGKTAATKDDKASTGKTATAAKDTKATAAKDTKATASKTETTKDAKNSTGKATSAASKTVKSSTSAKKNESEQEKEKYISSIYNMEINKVKLDAEKYLTETARNAAVNNEDIIAVGAMFEPYKFDKNIKSYSFYVSETDADSVIRPFGVHSEYSKEEYYVKAVKQKQTVFTEPYKFNGVTMVSVSSPIIYNNDLKGVILSDINVTNFSKVQSENKRYPSMYATIYNGQGVIIYDSRDIQNVGKNMSEFFADKDELAIVQNDFAKGEAFSNEATRADGKKITRYFTPIKAGNTNWWAMTALETSDMNQAVTKNTIGMSVMALIALVLIVGTVAFVLKRMLSPIDNVVKAAEEISNGNFDIHLEAKSEDEIGILIKTFDNTAQTLKSVIEDISNVLNSIADKNLDVDTSVNYVGDLEKIDISIKNIIKNLNEIMGNINQSADQVASGSGQVSNGAQALSQGATEQASSIEELSATITEISSQIKKNAENARTAREESTLAVKEVEDSNQKMQEMIQAIGEISDKSGKIGKIIKTIEDIAFQTNILALNAAVEAARAGVAGRGFAVVADEVRNLASKSAEAAKNTTTLIEETVLAVENGTKIADITANSMHTVVDGVTKVTGLVDDIAIASGEQADSIAQVTQGVEQISNVVQTNSATAEESAAASEELTGQAQILKEMVGGFRFKGETQTETLPETELTWYEDDDEQNEEVKTEYEEEMEEESLESKY